MSEGSTIGGCETAMEFGHMFIHIIFVPDSNLFLAEMKPVAADSTHELTPTVCSRKCRKLNQVITAKGI